MEKLPIFIPAVFLLTVLFTFVLLVSTTRRKLIVAVISIIWLTVTGILSYGGFFRNFQAMPPRLFFTLFPTIVMIIFLLVTPKGRRFIDDLDLKRLTLLHTVRVPVELGLYSLAVQGVIPGLMTFEGRNFDIFSGITAPIMLVICFRNGELIRRKLLLVWNFVCLGLLINIVTLAILASPFPFQKFAFDQPNVAVFYFPYTWLPAFVVTAVLFSHVVAIRKLLTSDHSLSLSSPSIDRLYSARS